MKIEFTAFPRNGNGTGPSRRMRRTGSPRNQTAPSEGVSSMPSRLSSVDLPEPLRPTIAT